MSSNYNEYYSSLFENNFPAQNAREKQRPAVIEAIKAFHNDFDVVLIDAPPGLGKSVILYTIAQAMQAEIFYTTPLNTLVDQIEDDPFMEEILTIKGRNHYECIHDAAKSGVTVDKAPCQKNTNFDCEIEHKCKYYGRKDRAYDYPFVVTNLSYIMADSMLKDEGGGNSFDDRDVLIVDEAQNIDDFALDFVSFTVSKKTVPIDVWREINIPHEKYEDDQQKLQNWLDNEVLDEVRNGIRKRESKKQKTNSEVEELDKLRQFERRTQKFLIDCIDNDWTAQIDWAGAISSDNRIQFKPVTVGRFLHNLLWDRGEKIILSSATIPKGGWLSEIGLGEASVKRLNIGSLFPVKNRPIITSHSVGKMTYNEKHDNMKDMAMKIKDIADYHKGENGLVHCRSYQMAESLQNKLYSIGYTDWFDKNVYMQEKHDRKGSLEDWIDGDKQLFFSINMSEGISLDDDQCRFQILAKVLYPFMGDKRTKYRVNERGDWTWYNNQAAIQIEQAYGRAVRSEDDYASFYILDESAISLINRKQELFHDWFLEAMVETEKAGIVPNLKPRVLTDVQWY